MMTTTGSAWAAIPKAAGGDLGGVREASKESKTKD
jgi:hypothetical protein